VDAAAWAESYRVAWETADDDLVVTLFTEDATYRSLIFDEPNVGHDGVRAYWQRVTSRQSDVSVRMGRPFVDGDRVTVEWWTQMKVDGDDITLVGSLLLMMAPDGRCRSLREYWNTTSGRVEPPPEWGT
jgi:ketosteroid isomerase-like protein